MNDILENLAKVLASGPARRAQLRQKLQGKVSLGTFVHDINIIGRVDENGDETFGRLDEVTGEFVPFTDEEDKEFKRKFAWHFTKIFDKNNVIPFPVRKPAQS